MKAAAIFAAALAASAQATTFYFDSAAGSDANDGLTPATAWQTLGTARGTDGGPMGARNMPGLDGDQSRSFE